MCVSMRLDRGVTVVRKSGWGFCSQSFQSPEGADVHQGTTPTAGKIQTQVRPVDERIGLGSLCALAKPGATELPEQVRPELRGKQQFRIS